MSKILIFLSLVFTISIKSFISLWVFIEINLIRYLIWQYSIKDCVSMVKYFLIQAFFSSNLLFLFLIIIIPLKFEIVYFLFMFIILRKLGTPPIFIWFINFCLIAKIKNLLLASTIQKLIPFFILYNFTFKIYWYWVNLIVLCVCLRLHRSLNIKKILAFSALFNIIWVLMALSSIFIILIFMLFYGLNLLLLVKIIEKRTKSNLFSDLVLNHQNKMYILCFFRVLVRIIGMPPFNGFFTKILILEFILNKNIEFLIILSLVLLCNIFLIFAYFRLIFLSLTLQANFNSLKFGSEKDFKFIVFMNVVSVLWII